MTLEDMLRNAPFLPFGKPRTQTGVGRLLYACKARNLSLAACSAADQSPF